MRRHTFVEFFDYNCPYCRASNPTIEAYYEKHKNDARFAFIEFPIKGENSNAAARLALAARKQPDKYLAFHFALMREKGLATPAMAVAIAKKVGLDLEQAAEGRAGPVRLLRHRRRATRWRRPPISTARRPSSSTAKIREGALDDETLNAMLKGKAG